MSAKSHLSREAATALLRDGWISQEHKCIEMGFEKFLEKINAGERFQVIDDLEDYEAQLPKDVETKFEEIYEQMKDVLSGMSFEEFSGKCLMLGFDIVSEGKGYLWFPVSSDEFEPPYQYYNCR